MTQKESINLLTEEFFSLFTTKEGTLLSLNKIHDLCLAETVIVKNVKGLTEVYDLPAFIEPREILLNSGVLTGFSEHEISDQTSIFGHIAQRMSVYQKSGQHEGEPFETRGMKIFQFVLTRDGWRISAMAWDDESDVLKISETPFS